jgi:hypothetical protein
MRAKKTSRLAIGMPSRCSHKGPQICVSAKYSKHYKTLRTQRLPREENCYTKKVLNHHSSIKVSCCLFPRTLLLLLFFEMFMKLSLFFMLPFKFTLLLSLFRLLLPPVSGRLVVLDVRPRLVWLMSMFWYTGNASGAGEPGVAGPVLWRKLRLMRCRLSSLLGLRVEVATEASS